MPRAPLIAVTLGALLVLGSACEPGTQAAAQTVEGSLRIVRTIVESQPLQVAWSSDGRYVAAALGGTDPGYAVWDATTGRKVRELRQPYGDFSGGPNLLFAPDSKHLVVWPRQFNPNDPKSVSFALWNFETGGIDRTVVGPSPVGNYAFSAEAKRFAVLYSRNVVITYDTRTWEPISRFVADRASSGGTAFVMSSDGKLIAAGGADGGQYRGDPFGRIVIHDVDTGWLVRVIDDAHQDRVARLAFIGSDALASTARQGDNVMNSVTKKVEVVSAGAKIPH